MGAGPLQGRPLLIHGDAAFAGQGVVAECFALMGLKGYRTGGTLHFVINNQIGFTTSPRNSRSSPYPSDVALMVQAPIFHVNGDDPEAVVHACRIATEFRQQFKKDVVVDMFCYRRFGHNESDEPAFTQPLMYRKIASHPTTRQIYADKLVEEGTMTREEVDRVTEGFQSKLDKEFEAAGSYRPNKADWLEGAWSGLAIASGDERRGTTDASMEVLQEVGKALTTVPATFNVNRKIARQLAVKEEMFKSGEGIDWATGEALAFGSLLLEGHPVRLSGQDSERGTFTQRHSVLNDQETGETYTPLENPVGYVASGSASWYGNDFHGRLTANGEIFSANGISCASPVLPLPSYVRVTNVENGRSVVCRVNDRGPYLHGRVMDLSYRTAEILGYANKGVGQIQVQYIGPAPLNGDDTRMLLASVDRLTTMEAQTTRLAMLDAPHELGRTGPFRSDAFAFLRIGLPVAVRCAREEEQRVELPRLLEGRHPAGERG